MTFTHPLSKYGLACVYFQKHINSIQDITPKMLSILLREGLNKFRLFTTNNPLVDEVLKYEYLSMQYIIDNNQKGDPSRGIYLSPNIITTDKQAANCWSAIKGLIDELEQLKDKSVLLTKRKDLTQSLAPISGKLNNGSNSQSTAKASLLEVACCAITTTTPIKPYKLIELCPSAIIPDLDINDLVDFIDVFDEMSFVKVKDLMTVKFNTIKKEVKKKKEGDKEKVPKAPFRRPPIVNGNFPDAPSNDFFGGLALLGAIGKWSDSAENSNRGKEVLKKLIDVPIYTIQHGNASVFSYNHYIIELAKENKLNSILFGLLKTQILSEDFRSYDNTKYKLFDFLSSRFLLLFDKPAFKDLLSIRAEYPRELETLFTTFFKSNKMKIRPEVVESVRELGLWLNYVAYKTAKDDTQKNPDKLSDVKNKFLIELESSAFGAKSNTALFSVITRASRLSGRDAPAESDEFMKAVSTEEVGLDDAKNLIMAYMRLKNRYEPKEVKSLLTTDIDNQENNQPEYSEAISDAQS
jgi:hypothetical protein